MPAALERSMRTGPCDDGLSAHATTFVTTVRASLRSRSHVSGSSSAGVYVTSSPARFGNVTRSSRNS